MARLTWYEQPLLLVLDESPELSAPVGDLAGVLRSLDEDISVLALLVSLLG